MTNVYKRTFTIVILLLYLTCFHHMSQAQEHAPSWHAIGVAMSENGRFLAVKSGVAGTGSPNDHTEIWIYDLENLLLPPQYQAGDMYPGARMTFSPNNQYLAVGDYHELSIFDIDDSVSILDLQRTSTESPTDFGWISFSPDSNYVMSFSDWWALEHEMSIWNIHTGQRIHAIDAQPGRRWVYYTWLSPNWSRLARWSGPSYPGNDTIIYEFDIEQGLGQPLAHLARNSRTGVFSSDGSLFAVVIEEFHIGGEVKVQVYETDTWTLKSSQPTSARGCEADIRLRISHDNSFLVFVYGCMFSEWASVWNLATDELIFQTENHPYSPLAFTLDEEFMLGVGKSGIAVWNTRNGFEFSEYPGKSPQLHPNGELMAAIGPDGRVWIWNIRQDKLLVILPVPRH